ncbi:MAG TPA: hypothetical protein VE546_06540, partial [Streptomyces sp.]|nr:hypothetical protein [Streptomyces sp.]
GEAIDAFEIFWHRYCQGGGGWLNDLEQAARDLAKALDDFADEVEDVKDKIDTQIAISAATIAAGIGLAVATAGAASGAAVAAAATITELAASLGVAISTTAARIAATTLVGAAFGGIESVAVDLAVAQPMRIHAGLQDGLDLAHAQEAGQYGTLFGGTFGAVGSGVRGIHDAGGIRSVIDNFTFAPGFGGLRPAMPGVTVPIGPSGQLLLRESWKASDNIRGPAAGKDLRSYNPRHTISGAGRNKKNIRENNSVILRGKEEEVKKDIEEIANGNARYDERTDRYMINGRSYGVEPNGTVYPDSGPGIVKLDRNEYAALCLISRAKGDLASIEMQLQKAPRFANNPEAVQKALAVYNGTYE